jgi:hypothetical protein
MKCKFSYVSHWDEKIFDQIKKEEIVGEDLIDLSEKNIKN